MCQNGGWGANGRILAPVRDQGLVVHDIAEGIARHALTALPVAHHVRHLRAIMDCGDQGDGAGEVCQPETYEILRIEV